MKKTEVALALYKAARENETEQYLYLNCLDKIKATMTDKENKELSEKIETFTKEKIYIPIKKAVETYFGVDITNKSRKPKYSYPRHLYCYFCYKMGSEITEREIADYIGISRPSVVTGKDSIEDLIFIKDSDTLKDIEKIKELINFEK